MTSTAPAVSSTETTILGIRHHGPGSAGAVGRALAELDPDAVLIEGPPEAAEIAALAAEHDLVPPVAMLVYAVDQPRRASFYPLAAFSPEWVAIRHALATQAQLAFIDLPAANQLADNAHGPDQQLDRRDPIGTLATAAGYDDPERWWEDVVEHRHGALEGFAEITAAMAALREDAGPDPGNERREAAMRRAIRQAAKAGHQRIAVVCGAWHAPALEPERFPPASHDDALLRGLPKVKVAATWVPWTFDRLAFASGYGAGVTSPGWYEHLFAAPDRPIARWLQRVAALLREEGLDASPASVVESTRLADALGALRGRPLPGLGEVQDAALSVLCQGDELRLDLIHRRLVVGERLGRVPDATPMVPLVKDLTRLQRSLRLAPSAQATERELDLRKRSDRERSRLLHRLALLDIPWGVRGRGQGRTLGTFKEIWRLEWHPELSVRLIEASRYGATVLDAAQRLAEERAAAAEELAELTALVEDCLLAGLDGALPVVMRALSDRAARDADIGRLMDAIGPLARVQRYGNVRGDDTATVTAVLEGLLARVYAGLPSALGGLDDDAAMLLTKRIEQVAGSVGLLERADLRERWFAALAPAPLRTDVHGLIAGRITRLLLDAGLLEPEEARRRLALELSRAADADRAAVWLEGFLSGTGLLLLHDPALLAVIDEWIAGASAERFDDLLPILRRTFSNFAAGERRQIGDAVRAAASDAGTGPRSRAEGGYDAELDLERAEAALATVLELLG
jgi:Family of unknown function (DUF5682)